MNWKGILAGALVVMSAAASAQVNLIVSLKRRSDATAVGLYYRIPLIDRTPGAPFVLYQARDEAHAAALELKMASDPRIEWVEEDDDFETPEGEAIKGTPYKGSTLPSVGERSLLYKANANMLTQINFDKTAAAATGRLVRVAILDTGLSKTQTYLWNKVDYAVNFVEPGQVPDDIKLGYNTNGNSTVDEAVGHGTMVTGLIDQIAPKSRFTIVRVADSDGVATAWNLIKGLAYAVVTGCEVANVSLGAEENLPAMSDVMDWCEANGLVVVASMGNRNVDRASYPARISKVIAVGALLPDNTKAPFSNWDGHCDFSAPGTGLISQWHDGQIGVWSGTSFSAPLVTGAIADGLKRTTRLAPETLRLRIENVGGNLDDLNPRYDGELGRLLNVRAITSAIRGPLP